MSSAACVRHVSRRDGGRDGEMEKMSRMGSVMMNGRVGMKVWCGGATGRWSCCNDEEKRETESRVEERKDVRLR
ncbi:hypothetical protein MRB53_013796 [Persea americana]|uniref:Uncharacterized protein n=1 Tax=Persea americana TaxID=3435 RepID=A0ACC2K920_PERAE|nr:hypothetical protein MRB53_013796 [Persea americana]